MLNGKFEADARPLGLWQWRGRLRKSISRHRSLREGTDAAIGLAFV